MNEQLDFCHSLIDKMTKSREDGQWIYECCCPWRGIVFGCASDEDICLRIEIQRAKSMM